MDSEVVSFYSKGTEWNRLELGCMLEEARTRQIIARRLPKRTCAVADIGAGPGAYAFWLAGQGHTVTLVDLTPLHVEQARAHADKAGVRLAGYVVADARELPLGDAQFDVALLLGPLYHLVRPEDRLIALREARRILRPGGLLFAAAISRYGSVTDGFFSGLVSNPAFVEMMENDVRTGIHINKTGAPGYFTTAYFHRPQELRSELTQAGLRQTELLAVESVFSYIPDFETRWKDEAFRLLLLRTLEAMESDGDVVGLGGHIIAVGRKPEEEEEEEP